MDGWVGSHGLLACIASESFFLMIWMGWEFWKAWRIRSECEMRQDGMRGEEMD